MADYQDQGQGQVASLKPKPPVSALKLSGERETESGYQKVSFNMHIWITPTPRNLGTLRIT